MLKQRPRLVSQQGGELVKVWRSRVPDSGDERKRKPGKVNATPDAILSPALPVVCIILFSRIVVLKNLRPNVIAITAMGIEAETVKPAFKARYTVAAPKITPNKLPNRIDFTVNSFIMVCGDTKG